MLGSFNNWNIVQFLHKATSSDDHDKIYQVVLDGISNNIYALVQTCQYGTINTTDMTTIGYYVIKFLSEYYTLQEDPTSDEQISPDGEILVK